MALHVPEAPGLPHTSDTYLGLLVRALFQHFILVGRRLNGSLPKDGTEAMDAPLTFPSYTVAGVPAAATYQGGVIYVSNEAGGKTMAFSDGTNWRRVQDRVIVS